MVILYGILAGICLIWGITTAVRIALYNKSKGFKVNLWLLRFMIIKYFRQYKEITLKEFGKPGPLYYHFIISHSFLLWFLFLIWVSNFT